MCVPECWSHGGLEREPDLPGLELPNAGTWNWTQVPRKAASTINHQAP